MKTTLLYITDIYCCWCYGFSSTIRRIADDFGDRLDIRIVNGGMVPHDLPLQSLFAAFSDPLALHARVSALSGQVFGEAYLDHLRTLRRSERVVNSLIPARAMHAFKALGNIHELRIATEIQHAYYRDGLDLNQSSTYEHVAAVLNMDVHSFEQAFKDPATIAAVEAEHAWVQRIGVRGFPALLLAGESGLIEVARGFTDFDSVRSVLDRVLSGSAGEAKTFEAIACELDGGACR